MNVEADMLRPASGSDNVLEGEGEDWVGRVLCITVFAWGRESKIVKIRSTNVEGQF